MEIIKRIKSVCRLDLFPFMILAFENCSLGQLYFRHCHQGQQNSVYSSLNYSFFLWLSHAGTHMKLRVTEFLVLIWWMQNWESHFIHSLGIWWQIWWWIFTVSLEWHLTILKLTWNPKGFYDHSLVILGLNVFCLITNKFLWHILLLKKDALKTPANWSLKSITVIINQIKLLSITE